MIRTCHSSFPYPDSFQEDSFNIHFISIRTVVQLNSEVVKLNRERKVQSTDSFFFCFFFNPKEFITISCIVEKCWKIAFHLKVDRKGGSLQFSG